MNTDRVTDVLEQAIERGDMFCHYRLHYFADRGSNYHCTLGVLHLETHDRNYHEALRCMKKHNDDNKPYHEFSCQFTQKFDITQEEVNTIIRLNDSGYGVSAFQDMIRYIKNINDLAENITDELH